MLAASFAASGTVLASTAFAAITPVASAVIAAAAAAAADAVHYSYSHAMLHRATYNRWAAVLQQRQVRYGNTVLR